MLQPRPPHSGRRVPRRALREFRRARTTAAFSSASSFPKAWRVSARAHQPDRIGGAAPTWKTVEDLHGMIVNVEMLDFPRSTARRPSGASSKMLGHPDDFGVDVEVTHPQAPSAASLPGERTGAGASGRRISSAEDELAGRRDFRSYDMRDHRRRDRARLRRRRLGGPRLPAATTPCTFTSPTSATTCGRAAPIDLEALTARHQRLLPRSRRADAAAGALHRDLLAEAGRRPADAVRAARDRSRTATSSARSSAAASSAAPSA